ncbi:MAG: hypothetical protein ACRYE8_06995 [Janthinobacterium lividum]
MKLISLRIEFFDAIKRYCEEALPAWISFTFVIPRLDRGIQLKILILLVFFIVFLDAVVKPRHDTESTFRSTQAVPEKL